MSLPNIQQHIGYFEQIALLVDGELGESERIHLLAELDHVPDGWKHCALLYIEDQELKKAFSPRLEVSHLLEGHSPFEVFPESLQMEMEEEDELEFLKSFGMFDERMQTGSEERTETDPAKSFSRQSVKEQSTKGQLVERQGAGEVDSSASSLGDMRGTLTTSKPDIRAASRTSQMPQSAPLFWAAIAGCLILGFSTGFLLRPDQFNLGTGNRIVQTTTEETGHPSSFSTAQTEKKTGQSVPFDSLPTPITSGNLGSSHPGSSLSPTQPQLRLVSLKHDSPFTEQVQLPCYEKDSIEPSVSFPPVNKSQHDFREKMRNAGHDVQVKRSYLIVGTATGERILVPVEDIFIQYSGNNLYE
ncbi:MAG: hypothetical protein ACRC10_10185 [Thermoguttaceae bacterium]